MTRLYILGGFAFLFLDLHLNGNLNKYINMKYAYLSVGAIVLFALLFAVELWRLFAQERAVKRGKAPHADDGHHHDHHHDHGSGHAHGKTSKLSRRFTYAALSFPILTGVLLPVQTLDSSFVKAKGFSFPSFDVSDVSADNPGYHQFLRPDTSVFYGKEGYRIVSHKELNEFLDQQEVILTDQNYLKGLEAIYNYPDRFAGKTIGFDGFIYKGRQVDDKHDFLFRFGFIHCVADSGVFGMLLEFPSSVNLKDDDWIHVTGTLGGEYYQPFKETIPVLKVREWNRIDPPKDPYVYRTY